MTLIRDTDTRQQTSVLVVVRVPHNAAGDLATVAEQRLSRIDGVAAVTVDELRGLEPGLSATIVTIAATLETNDETAVATLCDRLTDAPCVEEVAKRSR